MSEDRNLSASADIQGERAIAHFKKARFILMTEGVDDPNSDLAMSLANSMMQLDAADTIVAELKSISKKMGFA